MRTITQYKEEIKALMGKVGDIEAKATNESRDLTTSETALIKEILDTVEEKKNIVSTMERRERVSAALEGGGVPATVQNIKPGAHSAPNIRTQDRFNSFGEQLSAVMNAGRPGGNVDPRLFNAATGLNETVPSDGGLK